MTISIDQKGLSLELKSYALDNNIKDLLLNGRTAWKSMAGEQIVRKINLAPGDSFTYDSIGELGRPTVFMARVENGVLMAEMTIPGLTADSANYDSSSGRAGAQVNYNGGTPSTSVFEIDRFFFWSGSFITLILTNPTTAPLTVQLTLIEG